MASAFRRFALVSTVLRSAFVAVAGAAMLGVAAQAETAIEQADAAIRKARAAAAQSGRDAGRLDELAARGSVPQQGAEFARLAAQSSEADVTASEQARIRAQKLAEQAHLGDDKVRAKADEIAALEAGLAQAEAARAEVLTVRADLTIRSPISGVVVARIRSAGEVIAAGSPILDVVDLDRVYLKGYVPESQIGRLRIRPVAIPAPVRLNGHDPQEQAPRAHH